MAQFAATSSSTNSSNSSTTAAGSTPAQMLMSSSNGNLLRLASGTMGLSPALTSSSPRTPSAGPASNCCEGGRPLVPDPLTGQPVCGCQLESAGSGSSSAASMLLGLPSRLSSSAVAAAAAAAAAGMAAPAGPGASVGLGLGLGLYNPYAAAQEPTFLTDQSPFYAAANAGHDLKDTLGLNGGPGPGWPYPASMYYPYDPALAAAAYPFGGYGMDLNGARRKNATRETTATLKAWLSEHKKNPYPTKGEKIMLAIITKMTLTQVSTWFANARRRLKKENKMTWEPKNRNDDDDDDDSDAMDGEETPKDKHHPAADRHVSGDLNRPRVDWTSGGAGSAALKSPCASDEEQAAHRRHDDSDNIDVESDEEELDLLSSDSCLSPVDARGPVASSASSAAPSTAPVPVKPKIWSLADMAGVNRSSGSASGGASGVTDPSHASHGSSAAFTPFANHLTPAFTLRASPFMSSSATSGGGKMFPSIHSRLPGGGFSLDSTPYGRPPLYHPHRSYSGVPSAGGTVAPSLLADPRLYNVRLPMSSSSETLMAYSKLMSSSAQFQRPAASTMAPSAGGSLSSSPVENLEKLAALAAVSSAPTISTPPAPKTAAGN